MKRRGRSGIPRAVEIDCKAVVRALSSYLDNELSIDLLTGMRLHFFRCCRCRIVLDGTRNVLCLIADERSFDVPTGFTARLFRRVAGELSGTINSPLEKDSN